MPRILAARIAAYPFTMTIPAPARRPLRLGAALALLALLAACVTAPSLRTSATSEPSETSETSESSEASEAPEASAGESDGALAGTAWRLIEIRSGDGTTHRPREDARYTLSLQADGSMTLRADCNRGSGSWDSEGPWQIRFDAIATTRALCPPGSISERYLAELPRVRSYVLERGHLFLATRDDGAIIELEPVDGTTGG